MALKLARGISYLGHNPARNKIAAFVILFIIGVAIIPRRRDSASLAVKSSIPIESQGQAESVSPVRGDRVLANAKDASVKKTAKIVTCPRCRLNALPLVKKFVFEHAKLFKPNLEVDFILGEDPVLHLYDDGKEAEKIDLDSYDSKKIIQKLVQFGVNPTTDADVIREALGQQ